MYTVCQEIMADNEMLLLKYKQLITFVSIVLIVPLFLTVKKRKRNIQQIWTEKSVLLSVSFPCFFVLFCFSSQLHFTTQQKLNTWRVFPKNTEIGITGKYKEKLHYGFQSYSRLKEKSLKKTNTCPSQTTTVANSKNKSATSSCELGSFLV